MNDDCTIQYGQCSVYPSDRLKNAIEIWSFGIMAEYRGKGLGQQAVREIISLNTDKKTIVLFCHKDNARALHIYQKLGFKIVGEYRGGKYAWELRYRQER
jgi:ribosomal protein S18 acetylase RimI-like enzyme